MRAHDTIAVRIILLSPLIAWADDSQGPPLGVCTADGSQWVCVIGLVTQIGWPMTFLLLLGALFATPGARRGAARMTGSVAAFIDRLKKVGAGSVTLEADAPKAFADNAQLEIAGARSIEDVKSAGDSSPDSALVDQLRQDSRISTPVADYPYLLHQAAKVSAPSRLPYVIRVWVEFDKRFGVGLDEVARVYYRLDKSFPSEDWVLVADDHAKFFEIWMRVMGEFTIIAVVVLKNGQHRWLSRYLDLPGRPPD